MISNKIKGDYGEYQAQNYVKKLGYKILETNYKTSFGEIDIICEDKSTIVFIEVKYRFSLKYGRPSEAVTEFKQNKIRRVAEYYLIKNALTNRFVRFDVLEILGDEVNYISNAF